MVSWEFCPSLRQPAPNFEKSPFFIEMALLVNNWYPNSRETKTPYELMKSRMKVTIYFDRGWWLHPLHLLLVIKWTTMIKNHTTASAWDIVWAQGESRLGTASF